MEPDKNGELTPEHVSTGSNKSVWWKCPANPEHVWSTQVRARALDGDGCKYCAPSKRSRMDIAGPVTAPERTALEGDAPAGRPREGNPGTGALRAFVLDLSPKAPMLIPTN